MQTPDGHIICDHEGCESKIPNHKWGVIKLGAGWFFSRDNQIAFCYNHLPLWVQIKRGMT